MNNLPFTFPEVNIYTELREFALLDKVVLRSSHRMPFERMRSFTLNDTKVFVKPRFNEFKGHYADITFSFADLLRSDKRTGFTRVCDFHKSCKKWLPALNDKLVSVTEDEDFDLFALPPVYAEAACFLRVLREGDDLKLLNHVAGQTLPHFQAAKVRPHKRTVYFNDKNAYEPVKRNGESVLKWNGDPKYHPPRRVATVYLPENNKIWNKNGWHEYIVKLEERFSSKYISSRFVKNKSFALLPKDFYTLHQFPVMNQLFLSGGLIHLFDKKDRARLKKSLLDV